MKNNKSTVVFCGISKRSIYQTNDSDVLSGGFAKAMTMSSNRYEYFDYNPGKGIVCCGTEDGNFIPDTKLGRLNGKAFLEGKASFDEMSMALACLKPISPIAFGSFYSDAECLDELKDIPENRDIVYLKDYLSEEESPFVKENGKGGYVFDVFGSETEEVFKDKKGFYVSKEFVAIVFDPKTARNVGNGLGTSVTAEGLGRFGGNC